MAFLNLKNLLLYVMGSPLVMGDLQIKVQVQDTLVRTIDRGRNNIALASKLEQILGAEVRLWAGDTVNVYVCAAARDVSGTQGLLPHGSYGHVTGISQCGFFLWTNKRSIT